MNPSARQAIHSLNERTLLIRYIIIVIRIPKKLPSASPREASELENAVIKLSPEKNPPVYTIPVTQHITRLAIGIIRSITLPFESVVAASASA